MEKKTKWQFQNIPQELTSLRQWVLWRLDKYVDKKTGEEKTKKMPYQPNSKPAKTSEESTWYTFEEVVDLYEKGSFDGIGFVFTKDDPFVGIDFDEWTDETKKSIKNFDSYTEYSQSKRGVHIITTGQLPPKSTKRTEKYEMYSERRYFIFTGLLYQDQV